MTIADDAPPASDPRGEDLVRVLDGRIEPIRRPPLYHLALLLVTMGMVILPLVYLALVGLVGYGVFYHATVNSTILEGAGSIRAKFIAYLGPLFVGGTMPIFMLKPLFARPPDLRRPMRRTQRINPPSSPISAG